jgi:hypothetical protein
MYCGEGIASGANSASARVNGYFYPERTIHPNEYPCPAGTSIDTTAATRTTVNSCTACA